MLMFRNARSSACWRKQQSRRRKNVLEDHCPGSESHQKAEIPLSSKGSGSSPTRTIHWSKKRRHSEQKSPSQRSVALLARNLSENESKRRRSNLSLALWLPNAETEPKDLQDWSQVRKQNLFLLYMRPSCHWTSTMATQVTPTSRKRSVKEGHRQQLQPPLHSFLDRSCSQLAFLEWSNSLLSDFDRLEQDWRSFHQVCVSCTSVQGRPQALRKGCIEGCFTYKLGNESHLPENCPVA